MPILFIKLKAQSYLVNKSTAVNINVKFFLFFKKTTFRLNRLTSLQFCIMVCVILFRILFFIWRILYYLVFAIAKVSSLI